MMIANFHRSAAGAVLVAALVSGMAGIGRSALVISLDSSNGTTVLNASSNPASDGDAVATWVDTAGTPESASPLSGTPTYDIDGGPDGRPVINFSSANLVTGSTQARTVSIFHRWSSGNYLFDMRGGIPNSYVWQSGIGNNWTVYVNDSLTPTTAPGDVKNNRWQTTTFVGTSTGSDDMHIFSRFNNIEFGQGQVGEIRVYDTALNETERLAVVDELNDKWSTDKVLVSIATVTPSASGNNPDTVLISDAAGDYYYEAPNASGGGGGTSWHTSAEAGTSFLFDYTQVEDVSELILWDYYRHSPTEWTLELFSGAGATGTTLLDYDFEITPGFDPVSTRHVIDFADTYGVLSAKLTSRNNSSRGGTGLSEVAFVQMQIPEPSTLALAAFGLFGLLACGRRRRG